MRPRLLLSALLLLCLQAQAAEPAGAAPTVTQAWVRGTVPAQKVTGAFFTLASPVDATLTGVSAPFAERAELHEMKMEGDTMQMRMIARLPLPAGKPVALTPGGYHVMLFGLRQRLAPGENVPLTLTLESGGHTQELQIQARVMPLDAKAFDDHAKH
ncbi:copper chaperone PCu(A)C [Niveibacterium sp. SC-1]|uniref:copper chaperone PCu(A)C n=1 Tax=Niveibacterium sp. SC-1 TaxID=3135646 RepID=UPI00311E26F4